jgi:hypothetical protein
MEENVDGDDDDAVHLLRVVFVDGPAMSSTWVFSR